MNIVKLKDIKSTHRNPLHSLATWCEELTHWKKPWFWERLKAGEEGANRGWDGWMASPIQWTWIWVNSGSWWWTGGPGMLQSMGSQKVGHDWATELNYFIFPQSWPWLRSQWKTQDTVQPLLLCKVWTSTSATLVLGHARIADQILLGFLESSLACVYLRNQWL